MAKTLKNIAASVRQRLLSHARRNNLDFHLLLVSYCYERILYRLSTSDYSNRYMLKGGMLISLWTRSFGRFTLDIDFHTLGEFEKFTVLNEFAEILAMDTNDGLKFDYSNIKTDTIDLKHDCEGLQLTTTAFLDTAKIPIKIDLAYGDALLYRDYKVDYGSLLDLPTAKICAYSPETVLAEKFEAVVNLGLANSRIKDFYDLYTIPQAIKVDRHALMRSIRATFDHRKTKIPSARPPGLTLQFATNPSRKKQWVAYIKSSALTGTRLEFVVDEIWKYLSPLCESILNQPIRGVHPH